jgi:hypothetical protein
VNGKVSYERLYQKKRIYFYPKQLDYVALRSFNLQIHSKDSFGEVESGWIEVRAPLFSNVGLGEGDAFRIKQEKRRFFLPFYVSL